MDYFKRNRLLLSVIGVLVILNLATIMFILFAPPRSPFAREGNEAVPGFIERELGFSPEQTARFKELRDEFFQKGQSSFEAQAKAREAMFNLLKNPSVSDSDVRRQASVIGNLEAEHSMELFEHFRTVRALCTPEQQHKFDEIISNVVQRIAPLPMAGRPGRGGEPGGPRWGGPMPGGPNGPRQSSPGQPEQSPLGHPDSEQPREPAPR